MADRIVSLAVPGDWRISDAPAGGFPDEARSVPPWGGTGRFVRNVTHPRLTVVAPPPEMATGAAVIVAPGGGFAFLSEDSEGFAVADALAARGITALVLHYRTRPMPADEARFNAAVQETFAALVAGRDPIGLSVDPAVNPAVTDTIAALAAARALSGELRIDPARTGLLGFSAGGFAAHGAVLHGPAGAGPGFVGMIYAGVAGADTAWPEPCPPHFLAIAADDFLLDSALAAVTSLRARRHGVELHLYARGGHGFGMNRTGTGADLWLDQFVAWLGTEGFVRPGPPRT